MAGTSSVDKPSAAAQEVTMSSASTSKPNKEVPTKGAMAAHYEKYLDVSRLGPGYSEQMRKG